MQIQETRAKSCRAFRAAEENLVLLCRLHDIDPELVYESPDLDTFLDRVVEARLGPGPASMTPGGLRSLVRLATRAALTQAAASPAQGPGGPPVGDGGDRDGVARSQIEKHVEALQALSALCHKINNPLTALLGRAQLLQAHTIEDDKLARASEVMSEAGHRLAGLVRELAMTVKDARQEANRWLGDETGS